jgi:hypothetical protein
MKSVVTEPDVESSLDENLADLITDELMDILLQDAQENPDLVIGVVLDEADFKTKFPFNLEKEPEPVKPTPPPSPKVVTPKKTPFDLAREKYDA